MIFDFIDRNKVLWGWVVVIVGALFLLQALGITQLKVVWSYLWPIVIIVAGVQVLKGKKA